VRSSFSGEIAAFTHACEMYVASISEWVEAVVSERRLVEWSGEVVLVVGGCSCLMALGAVAQMQKHIYLRVPIKHN